MAKTEQRKSIRSLTSMKRICYGRWREWEMGVDEWNNAKN